MKAWLKYNKCTTWRGRVKIIYLYRSLTSCTMRETASYFKISLGAVSEALLLANHLASVKHIKTRRAAVNFIKKKGY